MDITQQQQILKTVDSLPVLPITVNNVMEVTNDPDASAQDLMNAVLPDQSMCISILKIANSALFGQPKQVKSIERAVMVLGFNEVQSIVLSKALLSAFSEYSKKHKDAIDGLWEHSFATGLIAKTIAEHVNLPSGDLFIGGLIHDIGKLILFLTYPKEYDTSLWMTDLSHEELIHKEMQTFSIDHTMAGSELLKKWSFPNMLLKVVRFHHQPEGAEKGMGYPLIIQLADCLAHLSNSTHLLEYESLDSLVQSRLPGIKERWQQCGLQWNELVMESWFAWLLIEKGHGGSIMSILSS